MKDLINKTTITGIIAVVLILSCMGFFFLSGSGIMHASESTQTQINQGLFGAMMLVLGYYFGSSHSQNPPANE